MKSPETALFDWNASTYGNLSDEECSHCPWCGTRTFLPYEWYGDDGSVETTQACPLCGWFHFTKLKMSSSFVNRSYTAALRDFDAAWVAPAMPDLEAAMATAAREPRDRSWDDIELLAGVAFSQVSPARGLSFWSDDTRMVLFLVSAKKQVALFEFSRSSREGPVSWQVIPRMAGVRVDWDAGLVTFAFSATQSVRAEHQRLGVDGSGFTVGLAKADKALRLMGCRNPGQPALEHLTADMREQRVRSATSPKKASFAAPSVVPASPVLAAAPPSTAAPPAASEPLQQEALRDPAAARLQVAPVFNVAYKIDFEYLWARVRAMSAARAGEPTSKPDEPAKPGG